jgi:hypothetical protein
MYHCDDQFMIRVRKSDLWKTTHGVDIETYEDFDMTKIESALVRAGVRGHLVKEIASVVKPFEGMTTNDIEKVVYTELEKKAPETAKFWKIKRDYDRSRFQRIAKQE